MKIETIELSLIRENDYNPNSMPRHVYEALVTAIRHHDYVQPIIVRPEGAGYVIVDGAHRFRALREIGRTRAQCVVVRDNATGARLRTLSMNRLRGKTDNFRFARALKRFDPDEARRYLAISKKQWKEYEKLLEPLSELRLPREPYVPPFISLYIMLDNEQDELVRRAFKATGKKHDREALLALCESYLEKKGESLS